MRKVFVLDEQGKAQALEKVYCTDEGKELQALIESNFDLLAGEQINPEAPRRWLLVKKEMPVPDPTSGANRWAIDFFFVDQDGLPTFVECKRYNDTRARREVIGQMFEYAANAHYYWSTEDLVRFAENTAQRRNENLDDLLNSLQEENQESLETFFERVENNLREAQVRLIFFLEEAPFELRSVVDFLNKQMERTEVLIIEAKQYRHGNIQIVVPSLFGFTEQARRIKKTITVTKGTVRKKWDRTSVLQYLEEQDEPSRFERVKSLLELADSDPHLFEIVYGTGQFPTIIVRNSVGKGILYLHSDGAIQLPAPGTLPASIELLRELEQRFRNWLQWKAKLEPGKYPSLRKRLEELSGEEFEKFKEFVLSLATAVKDMT